MEVKEVNAIIQEISPENVLEIPSIVILGGENNRLAHRGAELLLDVNYVGNHERMQSACIKIDLCDAKQGSKQSDLLKSFPRWAQFRGHHYTPMVRGSNEFQDLAKDMEVFAEMNAGNLLELQIHGSGFVVPATIFIMPKNVLTNEDRVKDLNIGAKPIFVIFSSGGQTDHSETSLAKVLDPNGDRTQIVVIMSARAENSAHSLKLKTENKCPPIAVATDTENEMEYFKTLLGPAEAGLHGKQHLWKSLCRLWHDTLKESVNSTRNNLQRELESQQIVLESIEKPLTTTEEEKSDVLKETVHFYAQRFKDLIEGFYIPYPTNEVVGGRRIYDIFFGNFPEQLGNVQWANDEMIENLLISARGFRPGLYSPESAFRIAVRHWVSMFRAPCMTLAEQTMRELQTIAEISLSSPEQVHHDEFPYFLPTIREEINNFLKERMDVANTHISRHIDTELAYFNLNHPDCEEYFRKELEDMELKESRSNIAPVGRRPSWNKFIAMTSSGPTCCPPAKLELTATKWTSSESVVPDPRASPVREPQPVMVPVSENRTIMNLQREDLKYLNIAVRVYMKIVRKNCLDLMPKIVAHEMVNFLQDNLEFVLLKRLPRQELLFAENTSLTEKRNAIIHKVTELEHVMEMLSQLDSKA